MLMKDDRSYQSGVGSMQESNEGRLPLKVLFHCRSSFPEGCLPTKVVFQIWKIFQFLRNFDAQIGKICKMHWKLRIKQTPVLFCKYLRNESLDLHEILCGGQILSCELKFQISWRSMHKNARARMFYCKCARLRLMRKHLCTDLHET